MPFDGVMLAAVTSELAARLVGARIDRVCQPLADTVVIHLRQPGENLRLLLSTNAAQPRVHLTKATLKNPPTPPVFCMLLRKHLEGGRILAARQPGLERVLRLEVLAQDEIGREVRRDLIFELMGKHSNLVLVDPPGQIILDGIKRYSHSVSRYREILPGRPYLPPPPTGRIDPLTLNEDQLVELVQAAEPETTLAQLLQQRLAGLSPLLCRELVLRSGLDTDLAPETCGQYELVNIWQSLQALAGRIRDGAFEPVLVRDGAGYRDFAPIHLESYPAAAQEPYAQANEALDIYFTSCQEAKVLEAGRQSLERLVKKELVRCEKKARLQDETVAAAGQAESYKLAGELIMANLYRLQKGDTALEAENYYDPEGSAVRIELDPRLTPAGNAQAYFKRYNKARSSAGQAAAQLARTRAEIEYLESIGVGLGQARDQADLAEIETELRENEYLARSAARGPKTRSGQPPSRPLTFISSDGFTILVGKNNRQNDRLTLKTTQPHDLWFHTKDIPGSHVIVVTHSREVPEQTLWEAAMLAAFHSKARQSARVPVDYTSASQVKKPGGARPGMVIYFQQKTLFVTPDSGLAAALAAPAGLAAPDTPPAAPGEA